MEVQKLMTMSEEAIRINKIASSPDDILDFYKDTPIYHNLLRRRLLARELNMQSLDDTMVGLFNLVEDEIKRGLLIY